MKETKFKQTEVGMIPSDWEVKTFCELFEVLPNNTLSRAELNKEYGSYKNVHYGDILVEFGEWIDCSNVGLPFINSNAKFNHTVLQDGDIVIADTAEDETVGKSTEITNAKNKKIVSGLHTIPIRPKIKFAPKWLGYYINSACWHDQILPFITGTKVSAISKAAVSQTKLFFPAKIEEQQRIANALSDVDTLIANLEKLIAKKKNIKQGAMQQLLTGKQRLSGFDGVWEHDKLGNIAEMNSGGTPSSENSHYYGGKIPFLSISDMTKSGKYIFVTEKSITQLGLDNSSARVYPAGTLLYAMYASLGKCSISKIDLAISQAILGFKLSNLIDRDFMYYYFCFIENTIKNIGQTGTQSNLSKSIVENFEIYHPHDVSEQQAIAKILSDMDTEIATLETKLAKYRKLKTGMMQQLLTGKIRLV